MTDTIVHRYLDADFSANNIGYIEPEPAIAFPDDADLVAHFRLGRSGARSMANRAAGGTDAVFNSDSYAASAQELEIDESNMLYIPLIVIPVPMTVMCVVHQTATIAVAQCLGGQPRTSASIEGAGLIRSVSSGYEAHKRVGTTNYNTAGLAPDGGERDEFLAAVFDSGAGVMKLIRPRTSTVVTLSDANWPSYTAVHRVLGNTDNGTRGTITGLWHATASRAYSEAEVAAVYASVQASLATSGIAI